MSVHSRCTGCTAGCVELAFSEVTICSSWICWCCLTASLWGVFNSTCILQHSFTFCSVCNLIGLFFLWSPKIDLLPSSLDNIDLCWGYVFFFYTPSFHFSISGEIEVWLHNLGFKNSETVFFFLARMYHNKVWGTGVPCVAHCYLRSVSRRKDYLDLWLHKLSILIS